MRLRDFSSIRLSVNPLTKKLGFIKVIHLFAFKNAPLVSEKIIKPFGECDA